jgi:hypothetical protein
VAIIAYNVTQDFRMDGEKQPFHAADCSTWIRDADGWECHARSGTFLLDAKAA